MQQSFFDVTPIELGQLGSELAVTVLREMLWAEVSNLGLPISDSDIPFAITTADGGVDASVKGTPKGAGNGLIFPPMTFYQVKAGDFALSATTPGQIEALLMTPTAVQERRAKGAPPAGNSHTSAGISPRVRACLDAGGAFVTVLFGNDNIDMEEDATENAIRGFLAAIDPKYANANVRVWRQSRICGLLRRFPAVSLQIKNLRDFQLLSHKLWAERPDMLLRFIPAPEQQTLIENLRAALRDDSEGMIHVRLIGEPGVGKTRLILETLRADDLQPLTLYADRGSKMVARVLALTQSEPLGEATHWTGRAMAKAVGLSLRAANASGKRTACTAQTNFTIRAPAVSARGTHSPRSFGAVTIFGTGVPTVASCVNCLSAGVPFVRRPAAGRVVEPLGSFASGSGYWSSQMSSMRHPL